MDLSDYLNSMIRTAAVGCKIKDVFKHSSIWHFAHLSNLQGRLLQSQKLNADKYFQVYLG